MKLEFNVGIKFIFGYVEDVNHTGPVATWILSEELNDYLNLLHDKHIFKRGRKNNNSNKTKYFKFTQVKKL